jgi:hypothetical protein
MQARLVVSAARRIHLPEDLGELRLIAEPLIARIVPGQVASCFPRSDLNFGANHMKPDPQDPRPAYKGS